MPEAQVQLKWQAARTAGQLATWLAPAEGTCSIQGAGPPVTSWSGSQGVLALRSLQGALMSIREAMPDHPFLGDTPSTMA